MALTRATDKIIANADGNLNLSGIVTATSFSGSGANLTGIDATAIKFGSDVKVQANNSGATVTGILTVSGNLSVGGTITYEDVTNVDSVGVVTARNGIKIGPAAGVAGTFFADGSYVTAGIITATSFSGSGANLTSLPAANITGTLPAISGANLTNINSTSATGDFSIADKIVHTGDTNTAIRFPAADSISFETGGTQRALFGSDGKFKHESTGAVAAEYTTSNGSGAYHKYELGSSGTVIGYTGSGGQLVTGSGADDFAIRSQANLVFSSGGATERLRIDSTGIVKLYGDGGNHVKIYGHDAGSCLLYTSPSPRDS